MADYERVKRLGAGNFGEVWLVYDHALDVQRAVKYVSASRIHDGTRFYEEPRILMELRHENIVRVEDAGKLVDGTLYIAMEYLPKGSLETIYGGQPVKLSEALKVLTDICWAVEYAHNREFLHRDIKPANILIGSDGRAKLSDFGLATRVPKGETASPYGYLTHVAPEVLRDNKTTKSTDIYALGVTAYRIINGDGFLPEVHDPGEIQDMVIKGCYPDRGRYRPYVPKKIQNIVNKCMALKPSDRFESAAAFRRALESVEIRCDWRIRRKKQRLTYLTEIGLARLQVVIDKTNGGKFSIETTKTVGLGQPRRITKDSEIGLSVTRMKSKIRQVLSRYVDHGK